MYREQYFEGGISSCYFWDQDNGGFAGALEPATLHLCWPFHRYLTTVPSHIEPVISHVIFSHTTRHMFDAIHRVTLNSSGRFFSGQVIEITS